MSSDRINGTLESHQKYQIAPPTVIVLLIGCLSGTILILLIIIGVCLVRGSPGYGKTKKSKQNTNSPHNNREGKLLSSVQNNNFFSELYRILAII